ncbi:MAG: tRNA guanosine(34) transglycosylase Tgt [Candidatus Aminicenantes bacterium]|nr:tRNA guanosine(34) transglycosylase Tgt [Candidatus Aminicenantes bacterium]
MKFEVLWRDKRTAARVGVLYTSSGPVITPAFMPVGTEGAVKGIFPEQLWEMGYRLLLSNLYHLYLRPGIDVIEKAGGISKFMGWAGSVLTDSGGFQIFSLSKLVKVEEGGIEFSSHIDGSRHYLTPEDVVEYQHRLKVDIAMVLDHFVSNERPRKEIEDATFRTIRWAERAARKKEEINGETAVFGIVQGGVYRDLRRKSAEEISSMGFDGYAIGGLGVGEKEDEMFSVIEVTNEMLPDDKPRYLMGIGEPYQMVKAISMGVDLFDCVLPTRNGRRGQIFTEHGKINIKRTEYREDFSFPDEELPFKKALLRHLYTSSHINSALYNTLINLKFFLDTMIKIRKYIKDNSFEEFVRMTKKIWRKK